MTASLFCVEPHIGGARPGHIGQRSKSTLPQRSHKVGRLPVLGHSTLLTSSAGREHIFWLLETSIASSQAHETEDSEGSCSAILIASASCTTAGN